MIMEGICLFVTSLLEETQVGSACNISYQQNVSLVFGFCFKKLFYKDDDCSSSRFLVHLYHIRSPSPQILIIISSSINSPWAVPLPRSPRLINTLTIHTCQLTSQVCPDVNTRHRTPSPDQIHATGSVSALIAPLYTPLLSDTLNPTTHSCLAPLSTTHPLQLSLSTPHPIPL